MVCFGDKMILHTCTFH